MSSHDQDDLVVTATLTSNVSRVTHGMRASVDLIDEILALEHRAWESTLYVGDVEYFTSSKDGPYPNCQMRVSARPSAGVAALYYVDHDDDEMSAAYSRATVPQLKNAYLVFNGETAGVFPQDAIIPIVDARAALVEWLSTRKRPMCIDWKPD